MFYKQFAAEYNCAAYGAGNYNSNESCQTLTNGGSLADTGTNVAIGVTGGVLLIAIGLASFILLRRKNVKKTTK
ncbi:MAG: transmembrane domain-containing protein [Candidatus Saccharimonas sp.]